MNLIDILKKVQLKLGRQWDMVGNEAIIQDILDGYRDICIKTNWSFFLKEAKIRLYPYLKQTVMAFDDATKIMTMQDGSDPLSTIYLYQRVYLPEQGDDFQIVAMDVVNSKITLDRVPLTTPVALDEVYLYVQDVALPADCAYNKDISIIDRVLYRRLAKVVEPTLTKATRFDWYTFDDPRAYMAKSKDYRASTDNSNYIMFWPFLNPTEKYLAIFYFRKPFGNFDTFTYTGGTTAAHLLPEVPDEFAHLLEWMALEMAWLKLGDQRMGWATNKKWEIMKQMLDANNGDAAMEHILKESPPYGYQGIPDFNTINVRLV